jgi:hypothetical protein
MIKEFVAAGLPVLPIPVIISPSIGRDAILELVARVGDLATGPDLINASLRFLSVQTAGRSALGFLYS